MGIKKYLLTEIGYDTSEESTETLIEIANRHCVETGRYQTYGHMRNVKEAIKYFNECGFEVRYKYLPMIKLR